MEYKHFGRIGDIWKHLPLCEIVCNEKINTYIETNSAYFDYKLEHSIEQDYGIGIFISKSESYPELKKSEYYKLIKPFYDNDKYLGSCGQVMHLLGNKPDKYLFFDLDKEALDSIEKSVKKLKLSHKVETRQIDSSIGLMDLIPKLNNETFVHIDPYLIHQPNKNGYSYLDVFFEASKKGIKCFLWYGYVTLEQKKELNEILISRINQTKNIEISCDELILNEIQENSIKINPGILGCGVLTSNLTQKSTKSISKFARLLVEMYKDSKFNGISGELHYEKITTLRSFGYRLC